MSIIFSVMIIVFFIFFFVTVECEMIAGSSGLGYYIVQMQYALRPEPMYAAIISLSATGYLINRAFVVLERWWIPWLGR